MPMSGAIERVAGMSDHCRNGLHVRCGGLCDCPCHHPDDGNVHYQTLMVHLPHYVVRVEAQLAEQQGRAKDLSIELAATRELIESLQAMRDAARALLPREEMPF